MRTFLLYAGPLLNLLSVVPYIIDVIRRKTKPNIVSWVTWTILTGIGTAAVIVDAGFAASLLPLSSTLCTLSIVLLGIKYGFAKYSRFDAFCQAAALLGLLAWFLFNSPLVALVSVIVIDAIAVLPTLRHSWKSPQEETWQTFALGSFASLLSLLAITSFSPGTAAYPIYLMIANGLIAGVIVGRRKEKDIPLMRSS